MKEVHITIDSRRCFACKEVKERGDFYNSRKRKGGFGYKCKACCKSDRPKTSRQRVDLAGQSFGGWTVLRFSTRKGGRDYWECRCQCGIVKDVRGASLTQGGSLKCSGCAGRSRARNLNGQRFGRLTVIGLISHGSNKPTEWLCICDCGKTSIAIGGNLCRGLHRSCGCLLTEMLLRRNYIHGQYHTKGYKKFHSSQSRAKRLKRYVAWADQNRMKEIYDRCPEGCDVDHIIPLIGKHVSGLHVPENLQYLPSQENGRKSNRFTPSHDPVQRKFPNVVW